MTDGPFRNAELSSRWKRYGQDLVSDAVSTEERTMQACHSMIGDVDMKAFSPLFGDLKAHAERTQMDLDPVSEVETIFENHPTSPLADTLQRHLIANLRDQIPIDEALNRSLESTAKEWIGTTKNRLDEECIRARELGDMKREDYHKGIERNRESFAAIKPNELCDALAAGNKSAFRQAVQKKAGVDEGPEE
jgi:type I site-specific restriction-modification system R (restriction) subunit